MARPPAPIRWFTVIWTLLSLSLTTPDHNPNEAALTLAFGIASLIALAVFRVGWVRWVFVAWTLLGVLALVPYWLDGVRIDGLTLGGHAFGLASLALLFLPSTRAWLTASQDTVAPDPSILAPEGRLTPRTEMTLFAALAIVGQIAIFLTEGHLSAYGLFLIWTIYLGQFALNHWRKNRSQAVGD